MKTEDFIATMLACRQELTQLFNCDSDQATIDTALDCHFESLSKQVHGDALYGCSSRQAGQPLLKAIFTTDKVIASLTDEVLLKELTDLLQVENAYFDEISNPFRFQRASEVLDINHDLIKIAQKVIKAILFHARPDCEAIDVAFKKLNDKMDKFNKLCTRMQYGLNKVFTERVWNCALPKQVIFTNNKLGDLVFVYVPGLDEFIDHRELLKMC